jgi:hypothetical protein
MTDFHETWYEGYASTDHPNYVFFLLFSISYNR